ncbi:MAG: hypothetical protein AAF356_01295 [Planctomycetota bacterium]
MRDDRGNTFRAVSYATLREYGLDMNEGTWHGLCLRHAGWRRVLGGVAAVVVVLGVLYTILTLAVPWVPVGGTWIYFVPIAALGVAIGAVGRPMLQRLGSRRACLALGRCAPCGYDLHETHPESDGCCRCRECGAAWWFSIDADERFGRMERISGDLGDRHPMRRRFAHEHVLGAECPICAGSLATGTEAERAPQPTRCGGCGSAWHARR